MKNIIGLLIAALIIFNQSVAVMAQTDLSAPTSSLQPQASHSANQSTSTAQTTVTSLGQPDQATEIEQTAPQISITFITIAAISCALVATALAGFLLAAKAKK